MLGTQALQSFPSSLTEEVGALDDDLATSSREASSREASSQAESREAELRTSEGSIDDADDDSADDEVDAPAAKVDPAKIRAFVIEHHGFVWRALVRLGVPRADAEDALQQVFIVATRKFGAIVPGCEKAFLYGTSMRVASRARRTKDRRRETGNEPSDDRVDPHAAGPEELIDRARARALLDKILNSMPLELRSVFTLYELEQLTMAEIAEMLALPPGTVASRLRRAREIFTEHRRRIERELTKKERV